MELLDIYDDTGRKNGEKLSKTEIHSKGLLHRAVCVWIMNSGNEILLQTRGDHGMFPGRLDMSFAGHVHSGEYSVEAAIREGYEELGITITKDNLKYLYTCRSLSRDSGCVDNEIDDVYLYKEDIPLDSIRFLDGEVKSVSYMPLREFEGLLVSHPEMFVPSDLHYKFFFGCLENNYF